MKAKKQILTIIGLALTCHITLTACQAPAKNSHEHGSKKHQESKKSQKSKSDKTTKATQSKDSSKKKVVPGIDKPTDDGFLLTDESQIENKTSTGIIVKHDGHSHFIFYDDLKGSKWEYLIPNDSHKIASTPSRQNKSQSIVNSKSTNSTDDGYVFNPNDIVAEDENGYTVRHGDHYHYIPKSQLTPGKPLHFSEPKHSVTPLEERHGKANSDIVYSLQEINYAKANGKYTTSDGYIFKAEDIISRHGNGYLARHRGHQHWIPKEQLSDEEKKAAEDFLAQKEQLNNPTQPNLSLPKVNPQEQSDFEAKLEKKLARIMKQYGLKREQITVDREKNAIIYPHGDHHHAEPIDEKKPYGGGHSHNNYEIFDPEAGVDQKSTDKVYQGEELQKAIQLLRSGTFNNQAFTLDHGQKRVSFIFSPTLKKDLGTNIRVTLLTPDGKTLEKLSGFVFGSGVGNIANFELDKSYLPGDVFNYTISSKDYPEVTYSGHFKVNGSLAYEMARHAIFEPFYAGDTTLRVTTKFPLTTGTKALVRVFDDFHGTPYLENNYTVGTITLPIPKNNQGTTATAGNVIPVTFMVNPYEENESYYLVEIPVLDSTTKPDRSTEAPEITPVPQPMQPTPTPEKPNPQELQDKLIAFAQKYGVGLDSIIFSPDGSMELILPDGKSIPIDPKDLESLAPQPETQKDPEVTPVPQPMQPTPTPEKPNPQELQDKLVAFAQKYGVGLDSIIFSPDGSMELILPDGKSIPIDPKDLESLALQPETQKDPEVTPVPQPMQPTPTPEKPNPQELQDKLVAFAQKY
ncbi:pneumococcal-type histidine triad protein, partial [Streptococcus hillyeri]